MSYRTNKTYKSYKKPIKPSADFALISRVAHETPYSAEYLSLLVRTGRMAGKKFGRNWHVSRKALAKYLEGRSARSDLLGRSDLGWRPVLASEPISPTPTPEVGAPTPAFGGVGVGPKKPEEDLAVEVKKELDELEELYKNHETRSMKHEAYETEEKTEPKNVSSYMFHDTGFKLAFPVLPHFAGASRGKPKLRAVEVAVVSIIVLGFVLGGFNLKFANAIYGAVKEFIEDAVTLQGHAPGTHANEVLLLDKEGKISIYGHIETKGQLRSYVEQGIAPIVVDSQTTVENLSADYLDNLSARDFTLQLVTKNGNVTFENVKLEGGLEVGKLLLVKNAAEFLDYVRVAKNLSVGGDFVVNGLSTFAGKIQSLAGALFAGRVEVKGDVDVSNFIAAQRAQIKEGGLMVSGHTQLNTLGVSGGLAVANLGVSGDFSVAGKDISLGDSGADKMTVTASSTFKGPFEVASYEAKFGRGISILANGLSVVGATGITGNTTITGDLTVSGSSSYGLNFGVGTTSPGSALGVKGSGIFDGFVSSNYFTSTSSLTSWLLGSLGVGTTTPTGLRLGVEGDATIKGNIYGQGTTTVSSLIATSTLEVRGASGSDLIVADGNVGIGTSTPGNLLSVHGNGNIQNNLTVENILKATTLQVTSSTIVSSGSTSSPAYAFGDDANTGITSGGGDDYLSLVTGGVVRLGIDKSGLVGIATSSPGAQLAVKGAGLFEGFIGFDYFQSTSTNVSWLMGQMGLGTTTPGARLGVKGGIISEGFISADYFTSTSSNSSWVMGNFGIGTTTPGGKLAVGGDAFVDGFYAMGTTTTSSLIATSTLEVRGTTGNDFVVGDGRVGLGSTTPNATLVISNDSSNSTADLLNIVNSVGSYNLTVTNGGSVGIGMYNPTGYLSVYGNSYLAVTEGNVGIGLTTPVAQLQVNTVAGQKGFMVGSSTTQFLIDDKGAAFLGSGLNMSHSDLSVVGGDINIGNDGKATSTLTSLGAKFGIYDAAQASTSPGAILSVHANTTTPAFLLNQAGAGDIFTLQDNGVTGLILRDGALLGVGTSTPTARFEAAGDALIKGGLYVQATSTMSSLIATSTLSVATTTPNNDESAQLSVGGHAYISGGLGIGVSTTSPGGLFVKGSGDFYDGLVVRGGGITHSGTATSTWTNGGLSLGGGGLNITSGGLYVDVGDSTFDQDVYISGNVGIGTTTPGNLLDVNGSGNFDSLYVQATSTFSSLIATSTLEVRGASGSDLVVRDGNDGTLISVRAPNRAIASTVSPGTTARGNLYIATNDNPAIDLGGSITFGSNYILSPLTETPLAGIKGGKEGSADNDFRGYLTFNTASGADSGALLERVRITSTGQFGIATTSAGGLLSVSAATTVPAFLLNQTGTGDLLTLQDGGSTVFTVKDGGNVGIGTTGPGATLEIRNSGSDNLRISDPDVAHGMTTTMGATDVFFRNQIADGTAGGIVLSGASDTVGQQGLILQGIIGNSDPTDTVAGLEIRGAKANGVSTQDMGAAETAIQFTGAGGTTKYMTILGAGNVGIGDTSPDAQLDIESTAPGIIVDNTGTEQSYVEVRGNSDTTILRMFASRGSADAPLRANTVGFWGQTNHDMDFLTNGTARMTIKNDGNLGIGTTGPGAKLDVMVPGFSDTAGAQRVLNFQHTDGTDMAAVRFDSSAGSMNFDVKVGGAWSNVMTLSRSTAGNIGIGTTGPGARLEVMKNGTSIQDIAFFTNTQTIAADVGHRILWQGGSGPAYMADIRSAWVGSDSNSGAYLAFTTRVDDTSLLTEKMRITSGGNVGIGTTSPASTLEIRQPSGTARGLTVMGASSGVDSTIRAVGVGSGSHALLDLSGQSGVTRMVAFASRDSADSPLRANTIGLWGTTNHDMDFLTNGTARMTIQNGGNVGIGTTNPVSSRLYVTYDVASEYVATFFTDGNNANRLGIDIIVGTDDNSGTNVHVDFSDGDNSSIGQITSSGGTVTYGAFTANHDVYVPEAYNAVGYPYGTLMCVAGVSLKDGMARGLEYNVDTCKQGDGRKVLGAYAGKYDQQPNLHQVYVLGDGHIRVNGEGGNIGVGDAIMVSATEGIGTKAYKSGMTIGVAQENVSFSSPDEVKLVAVQYGLRNMYATNQFFVDPETGNVGIGSTTPNYKLTVAGDAAATAFINISTRTAKKDIEYLGEEEEKSVLEKIKSARVATYNYTFEDCISPIGQIGPIGPIEGACPKRLGLIAEEAPAEVLSIDGKGVDIYKLSSFILAGVKAQQLEIDNLTARVVALEAQGESSSGGLSLGDSAGSGGFTSSGGETSRTFSRLISVAKSALTSIVSAMGDWVNGVLASTTKLTLKSETETEKTFETYSVLSSREEITASGSATLVMMSDASTGAQYAGVKIKFDESFVAAISETEPIKVILTPTTRLNGGLYVAQKSRFGFEAREINAQDEGGMFDWMVIARKRGGEETMGPISPISPMGPIEEEAPVVEEPAPAEETPVAEETAPAEETVVAPTEEPTPTETATTTEPAPTE